jgi:uncharacterized protein YeaO (DUF488 family)
MITLKRAYDPISRSDGRRILVERLWPGGLSKAKLAVDQWLKEAGPSTELRKWFGHDPQKWDTFRRRYVRELDSSKDTEHNNAVALQQYLRSKMRRRAAPTPAAAVTRSRR